MKSEFARRISYAKKRVDVTKTALDQTKENRAYNLAVKRHQDLLDNCPHENTEQHSRYYDGDYYNKAQTSYWIECCLCRKVLEEWIERENYYG